MRIEAHRKGSQSRYIVQAHPAFAKALAEYNERWQGSYAALADWRDDKAGRLRVSDLVEQLEQEGSDRAEPGTGENDDWSFDSDTDSPGTQIECIINCADDRSDDMPFFLKAAAAGRWFQQTVGLNFSEIEGSFKAVPVVVVPTHVSDRYGMKSADGLFAIRNDIRAAYVVSADLSAIAMCRACTELILKQHYGGKPDDDLTPMLRRIEGTRKFDFIRRMNLREKSGSPTTYCTKEKLGPEANRRHTRW